jgi:hypothetical protein
VPPKNVTLGFIKFLHSQCIIKVTQKLLDIQLPYIDVILGYCWGLFHYCFGFYGYFSLRDFGYFCQNDVIIPSFSMPIYTYSPLSSISHFYSNQGHLSQSARGNVDSLAPLGKVAESV